MKNMAHGTDIAKELENYRKLCLELEEKSKKDEMRCLMLETEIGDLKKKNEELEEEITRMRKVVSNGEKGKGMIVDLTDEDDEGDKFVQLLIENKVLECEKTRAEIEIRSWKAKVKELVSRVCELELKENMKGMNESSIGSDIGMVATGKTHLDTDTILKERVTEDIDVVSTHKNTDEIGDRGCSQARKRLSFEEDGCPNKKMAPSTPGVAQPPFSGVIDISDEDVNSNEVPKLKKRSDSTSCSCLAKIPNFSKNDLERTYLEHIVEDDMDGFEGCSRTPSSAKRKRTSNIITSDDEKSNDDEETDGLLGHSSKTPSAKRTRAANIIASDDDDTSDDDNAPICTLMKQRCPMLNPDSVDEVKENVGRLHLKRLRKPGSENGQNRSNVDVNETVCLHGYSSSEDEEDDDGVEEGSESEGESLGGFIVESSESCSEIAPVSDDSCDESEDALNNFKLTLDKIGRKKVSNLKWDLEGDMLADFGKDPELCMRAVCALYRQQTEDEKACKGTLHHNERGFSQCDASRASKVAEFLMDGDSGGDMNKTVEELEQYDSKGIKLCMALAAKYSKQLFEIYRNKEDQYFLP